MKQLEYNEVKVGKLYHVVPYKMYDGEQLRLILVTKRYLNDYKSGGFQNITFIIEGIVDTIICKMNYFEYQFFELK